MVLYIYGGVPLIKDRGNIKWVAMMLPEHVKLLRDWKKEDEFETMPELDEQQLEEMNEVIYGAIEENLTLQFTYYQEGELKKLVGNIHYVDQPKRKLRVVDNLAIRHILTLESIIYINKVEKTIY